VAGEMFGGQLANAPRHIPKQKKHELQKQKKALTPECSSK